jgi:hypothetical protein
MNQANMYGMPDNQRRVNRGCLWGIVILVAILGFVAVIVFSIFGAFSSSEPYQHALAVARNNETVTSLMGTPINPGFFTSGSMSAQGISGNADLQIPISGPKKSGTLYVTAERRNGRWVYFTLAVDVDNQIITLPP